MESQLESTDDGNDSCSAVTWRMTGARSEVEVSSRGRLGKVEDVQGANPSSNNEGVSCT